MIFFTTKQKTSNNIFVQFLFVLIKFKINFIDNKKNKKFAIQPLKVSIKFKIQWGSTPTRFSTKIKTDTLTRFVGRTRFGDTDWN